MLQNSENIALSFDYWPRGRREPWSKPLRVAAPTARGFTVTDSRGRILSQVSSHIQTPNHGFLESWEPYGLTQEFPDT